MLKKILKYSGWALLAVTAIVGLVLWLAHEKPPSGQPGPRAEVLTSKLEAWVGDSLWRRHTGAVQWRFGGDKKWLWDRRRDFVALQTGSYRVHLHTPTQRGLAWKNGVRLTSQPAQKQLDQAWKAFCNDSYWLFPFSHLRDPGVQRSWVAPESSGGLEGLLVTYTQGGVTPGDQYLWRLHEDGKPEFWKMWVEILPIGGVRVAWQDWYRLGTGVRMAGRRRLGPIEIPLRDVKAADHLKGLTNTDPFDTLDAYLRRNLLFE